MNKKVLAGLGLLDESEISESWNVFIRIACECKCQKCGKIHRFLDDIEYDKELFCGYSYKDFRKLCDTSIPNFIYSKSPLFSMVFRVLGTHSAPIPHQFFAAHHF